MNVTPELWRLTDKEVRAVEFRGNNMAEAQRAKRQAFIDNGGIILNHEALTDMYEVLKRGFSYLEALDQDVFPSPLKLREDMFSALAKAVSKA